MTIVEITEDKYEGLAENVEKAIKYMGKVMQCIDEMKGSMKEEDSSDFGERRGYGMRGGMGNRHYEDRDDINERMGYRGRYSRY